MMCHGGSSKKMKRVTKRETSKLCIVEPIVAADNDFTVAFKLPTLV